MRSEDLRTWTDVSGRVSSPPDHKHGTALQVPEEAWRQVCAVRRTPFAVACTQRGMPPPDHEPRRNQLSEHRPMPDAREGGVAAHDGEPRDILDKLG